MDNVLIEMKRKIGKNVAIEIIKNSTPKLIGNELQFIHLNSSVCINLANENDYPHLSLHKEGYPFVIDIELDEEEMQHFCDIAGLIK